jgi:hypothetical protein
MLRFPSLFRIRGLIYELSWNQMPRVPGNVLRGGLNLKACFRYVMHDRMAANFELTT